MFNYIYLETVLSAILGLLIYSNYVKISNFVNVYDFPDKKLKKHKVKTPIVGGLFNLIIFISFFLLTFKEHTSIIFPSFLIVYSLFGFADDKYNLNPNVKLIFTTLFVALLIILDDQLLIESIKFDTKNYLLNFKFLAYPFSILCILLLTHSLNMMDGINAYSASYKISITLTFILYISTSLDNFALNTQEYNELIWLLNISILFLITLFIFLYFNYKGLIFFGDGGIYLGSLIIGFVIIKLNNILPNFSPEIIFMILILPGIDMFRLFIQRIYKKQNPFKGDLNHFHHKFVSKFKKANLVFLITIFHLIINFILFKNSDLFFMVLIFYLLVFFFIIWKKNEAN